MKRQKAGPVTVYRPDPETGELVAVAIEKPAPANRARRPIGVWDDECQTWRVKPSTDYRAAVRYVVERCLDHRDPEGLAALGKGGGPEDLNSAEAAEIEMLTVEGSS